MTRERPKPPLQFEKGLGDLEALVARLEGGEMPLEEALAAFEAGVALVRTLTERLTEAEARIEVLTRSASGALSTTPLDEDTDTDA